MISIQQTSNVPLSAILQRSTVGHIREAETILRECVNRSAEVRYGYVDDKLACMWGLIPPSLLSETAYLWLLSTDLVQEHKFLFVRHSQRWIEETLIRYPVIVGDMIDNPSTRAWLRWLGAEFMEVGSGRFKFVIRKKVLQ